MQIHDPGKLLESLCALPHETSWVEFKENRFDEDSAGQYVSALANSAMLEEKEAAYLVYGVRDGTHEIVGTTVDLYGKTIGTDKFIFWLNKYLDPHITVNPLSFLYAGKRVEMLCIDPGYMQPVKFKKISYIRIEENQQPLSNYPERERALWQITSRYSFESSSIKTHMFEEELRRNFDFMDMLDKVGHKGESEQTALSHLESRGLIKDNLQGAYDIYSLLALTSAKNLNSYSLLENKGTRVIVYKGKDKLDVASDTEGHRGYLVGFTSLLSHIMAAIPSEEKFVHGVRKRIHKIPEIAIREFLANALVHQDFTQSASRPLVEIFKDRVKITNPGVPLVSVDRFIDTPSKTRNPRFAKLMRDAGFCEERGSGVDRAIREIERATLPPPLIEEVEGSTIVTVFMPRYFADMTSEERVRACFQHACLGYEERDPMNNASLRARFGLSDKQYPQVSAVIRDAIDAGRIKPLNEDQGNRKARYVPFYVM